MDRINLRRVLMGGVVAGVMINIGETVLNAVFLADRREAAMAALGVEPATGQAMAWYVIYGFLLGIAAVWLYAAIRPRFGPGPRTAAVAGLFVWFTVYALFAVMQMANPIFPADLIWIGTAWGLVEIPLATMAGAWFYREGREPLAEAPATPTEGAPAEPSRGV